MSWNPRLNLKGPPGPIEQAYPIGSLFFTGAAGPDPNVAFDFGVWVLEATGKVRVGLANVSVKLWCRIS